MNGRTLLIGASLIAVGYLAYRVVKKTKAAELPPKSPSPQFDTSLVIGDEPEVGTEEWEKWALTGGGDW